MTLRQGEPRQVGEGVSPPVLNSNTGGLTPPLAHLCRYSFANLTRSFPSRAINSISPFAGSTASVWYICC